MRLTELSGDRPGGHGTRPFGDGPGLRLGAPVAGTDDVVTLVDADGAVTYQSAPGPTGLGLPDLVGRPLTDWVHPDDVAPVRDALAAAARGEASGRVECRVRDEEGGYRLTETVVTNLLAVPTVAALVLNTRDITDRRLVDDQLQVLEERERIARDLHDVVIQRLFAVGLGLDALSSRSSRLAGTAADQVTHAIDELHHTIRDIRVAIFSLRTDEPSQPLQDRLAKVFRRAEHALGFQPEVRIDGSVDALPETVHLHLLATLNEALSNVARHAQAGRAVVTIRVGADGLVAEVADDGVGFAPRRRESGLANLRRRADLLGGTMTTEPGPDGTGLTLTWRVPLPGAACVPTSINPTRP